MGPLSLHIHSYLSEEGYYYKVKAFPEPGLGTIFMVSGLASGISSQIIVDDKEEYILFGSYSKYSFEESERFMLGMNHLNLSAPEGIEYYYCLEDSCIFAKLTVVISGSYPNGNFIIETLYHTINSLRSILSKLDGLKHGEWEPKCEVHTK